MKKIPPEVFWVEQRKKKHKHICSISFGKLKKLHSKELSKIKSRRDAVRIGTLLMGDYYLDGFGSRSCSARMASLVGYDMDYLNFYCGGSSYYELKTRQRKKRGEKG